MSREIKFRAWDGEKSVYGVENYHIPSFGDWCNTEGVIIEQYTGLKDKNDKEIYEGDIVVVMGYGTYKVFWREWDSSFSLMPIGTIKEETRVLMLCEDWENDYEVIGNIHENPELLEGENE